MEALGHDCRSLHIVRRDRGLLIAGAPQQRLVLDGQAREGTLQTLQRGTEGNALSDTRIQRRGGVLPIPDRRYRLSVTAGRHSFGNTADEARSLIRRTEV
jgi:hypothetical protein